MTNESNKDKSMGNNQKPGDRDNDKRNTPGQGQSSDRTERR
jgi:hypothetical protein